MACRSLNYCPGDILEMDLHQWASAPISWSKCKCSLLSLRCIWQGCLSAPKCCWSPSVPYILINSPFMVACKCTEIVGNTGCVGWILHLVLSWFYQLAYIFEMLAAAPQLANFPVLLPLLVPVAEFERFSSGPGVDWDLQHLEYVAKGFLLLSRPQTICQGLFNR